MSPEEAGAVVRFVGALAVFVLFLLAIWIN